MVNLYAVNKHKKARLTGSYCVVWLSRKLHRASKEKRSGVGAGCSVVVARNAHRVANIHRFLVRFAHPVQSQKASLGGNAHFRRGQIFFQRHGTRNVHFIAKPTVFFSVASHGVYGDHHWIRAVEVAIVFNVRSAYSI